jgi:hypothetical protein
MNSSPLLILVPTGDRPTQAPALRPLGRAALALESEGVSVLFGDQYKNGVLHGWRAQGHDWVRCATKSVLAVHDRYPSESRRKEWDILRAQLGPSHFGNPPALTLLCKDKLESQRTLERSGFPMPEVEGDVAQFSARLRTWGTAFLKPRYGSQGHQVRLLDRTLPTDLKPGAWVLQRAVSPPPQHAGVALRILVQRHIEGGWWLGPIVARTSATDPVVNASRGAEVLPAEELISDACAETVRTTSCRIAADLAKREGGSRLLELGLDFVVDREGNAHLIEVNSCPRGRLLYLAQQNPEEWKQKHQEACERPLRRLLYLSQQE